MDTPTCHLIFPHADRPHPPPDQVGGPNYPPKLSTPSALRRSRYHPVGETPLTGRCSTVRGNGAGGTRPCCASFSTFLSVASTDLRVATTGNHPTLTTPAGCLLTESGDVCLVSLPASGPQPSSDFDWIDQGQASRPAAIWKVKRETTAGRERDGLPLLCVYRAHEEVGVISPFEQTPIGEKEAITPPVTPNFTARRIECTATCSPTETLFTSFSLISLRNGFIFRWLTFPHGFPNFLGVRSSLLSNHHLKLWLLPRSRRRLGTVFQATAHSPRAAAGAHTFARGPLFIIPNVRPSQLNPSLEMNSPVITLPPPSSLSPLPDQAVPMQHESGAFALSSNPPNPKTNFRFGDWMYVAPAAL
jgi:hypothetical protein